MKARVIAYYLPQFHPVEVNDKFWGKGFTEWTNVATARPLFRGHYQPQIPADLGFYDLRIPQVRQDQADMARENGVEGFMYWNYWFGKGKKVLEMPIEEIMRTGEPDFPFCIGWANHDWTNRTWQKKGKFIQDTVFLKQEYLGRDDYKAYFYYCLPMFKDHRYITVDGKPLFYIYDPGACPDMADFISLWNELAVANGLKGIHFVGRVSSIDRVSVVNRKKYLYQARERYDTYYSMGFEAISSISYRRAEILTTSFTKTLYRALKRKIGGYALNRYDYMRIMDNYYMAEDELEYVYPQITPRKDRSPRRGKDGLIYTDSTPEKFRKAIRMALDKVKNKENEHKILFLNSWNEWGEGSYMEPDLVFGRQYLDVLREEIMD